MKSTEVNVNKKMTLMVNDAEHRAFKIRCAEQDLDMSSVLRDLMRAYVSKKKK